MTWGRAYVKSTVREYEDSAEIEGRGRVGSNDLATVRALAEDFAGTVDHNNEIAYDLHQRWRGRTP